MKEENPTELLSDREEEKERIYYQKAKTEYESAMESLLEQEGSMADPWGLEWEEMEQVCIYHRYSEMENEVKWERLNQEIAKHESQILSLKKETKALGYDG